MRARRGFTLLEILVAIGLTAALALAALQMFRQIHDTQERARPARRRDHTARVFLDRLERELVGTTLIVKPEGSDRLSFPWVFVAEDRVVGSNDSDAIRFITQTPVRAPGGPPTGLRTVSYGVADAEDDERLDLYRREERVGSQLRKEIRLDEAQAVLEDVHRFALRFEADDGWHDSWDSTDVAMLDALPRSVEVSVQLYERDADGELAPGDEQIRLIALPVRPFAPEEQLEQQLDPCEDGPTIEECIEEYRQEIEQHPQSNLVFRQVAPAGDGCWNDPDPGPGLEALYNAFEHILELDPLEACLP